MALYRTNNYGIGSNRGGSNFRWGGLILAAVFAGYALINYYSGSQVNEITGEKQQVGALTKEQEMLMGLESAPHMAQQHGGLYPDQKAQAFIKQVGQRIVQNSIASRSGYRYDFHLLADPQSVNPCCSYPDGKG